MPAHTIDPRTDARAFTCVGSSAKRDARCNFTTFAYYVRRSDFDLLLEGKQPLHMCYRSKNDGRPSGFKPRATIPAFRALLAEHKRTQAAHVRGTRAMVAGL